MKRIISVLLMTVLMTAYLQAENAVKSFETHRQGVTGGMIDDEIVFIYHKIFTSQDTSSILTI